MKSINFDNPYWLLILIPLVALLVIPYAIAIRKVNRSKSVVASMIIHLVIAVLVAFGVAGMNVETVVTETQVVVLADVSHSASKNLKQVDDYVREVEDSMPVNSKMSVVVFGRDYELQTSFGGKFNTVSGSSVDDSATDIVGALEYAGTLFNSNSIKRIVLITDGKQTDGKSLEEIVSVVEGLHSDGIKIDALYLDNNLKDGQKEAQISGVEYTKTTYLGQESTVSVMLESSFDADAILTVYRKDAEETEYTKYTTRAEKLAKGFNIVNFNIDNNEEGSFDYRLELSVAGDETSKNNVYDFTQVVEGKLRIIAYTPKFEDAVAIAKRYSANTDLEVYVHTTEDRVDGLGKLVPKLVTYSVVFAGEGESRTVAIKTNSMADTSNKTSAIKKVKDYFAGYQEVSFEETGANVLVPYTVEMLCEYDEIVLSNFDVRTMEAATAYVENLQTAVSVFGKTLLVSGDMQLHSLMAAKDDEKKENDEEEAAPLAALQQMLPVNYAPSEQDPKLYGIILDASRSMETLWHFKMAKMAAIQLVNMLGDDDYVTVVAFAGDVMFEQLPVRVGPNRTKIVQSIQDLDVRQGTYLGAALQKTLEFMNSLSFSKEQVMLITDGKAHTAEPEDPERVVKDMRASSIVMSVINTGSMDSDTLLRNLAKWGGGSYYYADTEDDLAALVLEEIAEEVTETVIEKPTTVYIRRYTDALVEGIAVMPDIYGFLTTTQKPSATQVLSVKYQKDEGGWVEVPLYSYWDYGEGKVAAFTSDFAGEWLKDWDGEEGDTFFANTLKENTPKEKNSKPFRVSLTRDNLRVLVEVTSYQLDPSVSVYATVTMPDGTKSEPQKLLFDKTRVYGTFALGDMGKYTVDISYAYDGAVYESSYIMHYCYEAEYDEFVGHNSALLHQIVRHRGTVSEDGTVDLTNDASEVEMYTQSLIASFMIAAVSLFIVDVIIRKLRWADIVGLFKKSKAGGKKK